MYSSGSLIKLFGFVGKSIILFSFSSSNEFNVSNFLMSRLIQLELEKND
jgi:hypothetical protein